MRFAALRVGAVALAVGVGGCAMQAPVARSVAVQRDLGIVASADARASAAGVAILRLGGSAVDAAVAMEAVLGLVEPYASGFLGGSVLLVADPAGGIVTYDGMPTAPAAATRALAIGTDGKLLDPREVAFSARAVGVPGTLPALWAAHQAQGKLPWASLFEPAIQLAEAGTPVSGALRDALKAQGRLSPDLAAMFADDRAARPNPEYATMLRRVARLGPPGLYAEGGMAALQSALSRGRHASLISADDLTGYRVRSGPPLCATWRDKRVCTAPPPAFGGLVALQILGMVPPGAPDDAGFVHSFLEASRLTEADRRRYLADPQFVPVPIAGLLDPAYLNARAALITPGQALTRPTPGEPAAEVPPVARREDPGAPQAGTSSIAVVDGQGRAVAMTSTINLHFGARLASEGMVLNNALINFAPPPPTALPNLPGRYANAMEPGKRPLSPVAPMIVLGADGKPILVGGGAGGAPIPDTMAMALFDTLGRGVGPAEALALGHAHAADPDHITLEEGTAIAGLRPALDAMGHRIAVEPVNTGTVLLLRRDGHWIGATDPRRDGGPALEAR